MGAGVTNRGMLNRRYTVLIADRTTGVVRRSTVSVRGVMAVVCSVMAMPVLIGVGARLSALSEIDRLRSNNVSLEVENGNFRASTGELTTQIQSLESVIDDLGNRSSLSPEEARAIQKLPAVVKSRAAGGNSTSNNALSNVLSTSLISAEDTFGALRSLLQGLESRLRIVSLDVARQERLKAATPTIWPAHGWLTGTFGGRSDPFTGQPAFHEGLDISAEKGQPVFATADGTIESTGYTGDYGNLVIIRHDFGLTTRYGHLSRFSMGAGASVKRGDVIGYVGSTGRSTGSHVHYEILANGKLLNPLQLLTRPQRAP
jgi:murein DD-endopeptidase MepM/ murein hydrolase activator NlpD